MKPLTSSKLAAALGVSKGTVLRLAKTGEIPYLRLPSGHYRFNVDEVRRVLEPTPLELLEMRKNKIELK